MSNRTNFERLHVYQLAEQLADEIWTIATQWDRPAQHTVGEQLIRACDSIGANIAEGAGRGSFQDNRRFVRIARGSLNETKHWLRRAYRRNLLTQEHVEKLKPIVDILSPMLNAYLKSIGKKNDNIEENNYHSDCVDVSSHPTDYELLTTNKT
jgi:four helix bundle protein